MQSRTKYLVNLALLCAIAYVLMAVGRIPVVSLPTFTLSYDPKDIIIVIGGLIYGPMSSFLISLAVSFIEMITVSTTAWIGFWMNVLSTCCFACTAAFIYKKKQTLTVAIIGLVSGGLLTVAAMLLWNYLLTPIFMGFPRAVVVPLLWSAFLPFNLLKVGINGTIIMLLYKPIVQALRKANLIPPSSVATTTERKRPTGVILITVCLLATCIFFVLVIRGVL